MDGRSGLSQLSFTPSMEGENHNSKVQLQRWMQTRGKTKQVFTVLHRYPVTCGHTLIFLSLSLPTLTRYCNITWMTVIIANEAVKTMSCVLHLLSPVVNQLQISSKKQWIALGFG